MKVIVSVGALAIEGRISCLRIPARGNVNVSTSSVVAPRAYLRDLRGPHELAYMKATNQFNRR
jgi:hypothetical protein